MYIVGILPINLSTYKSIAGCLFSLNRLVHLLLRCLVLVGGHRNVLGSFGCLLTQLISLVLQLVYFINGCVYIFGGLDLLSFHFGKIILHWGVSVWNLH